MPAVPISRFEPVWEQQPALLPFGPVVALTSPLGRHRRRIPDPVEFEHVAAALVLGSGYERIASPGCSDGTIRRRVKAWSDAGLTWTLHALVVAQYDRMIGLELDDVAGDSRLAKASCGSERAGPTQVDRGMLGLKRSTLANWRTVPFGCQGPLSSALSRAFQASGPHSASADEVGNVRDAT